METTGIEPATSWLQIRRSRKLQVFFWYGFRCDFVVIIVLQLLSSFLEFLQVLQIYLCNCRDRVPRADRPVGATMPHAGNDRCRMYYISNVPSSSRTRCTILHQSSNQIPPTIAMTLSNARAV